LGLEKSKMLDYLLGLALLWGRAGRKLADSLQRAEVPPNRFGAGVTPSLCRDLLGRLTSRITRCAQIHHAHHHFRVETSFSSSLGDDAPPQVLAHRMER
jgi:hypothetical protein